MMVMIFYNIGGTHLQVFLEEISDETWHWMKLCHDKIWCDSRSIGPTCWPVEFAHWEMNEWIHNHTPIYDSDLQYSEPQMLWQIPAHAFLIYTGTSL